MTKIKFKYDYKTAKALAALTAKELIAYKYAMGMQAENLKAEATEWALTYKILQQEIEDRWIDLEAMLVGAELDRIESTEDSFGSVGFIH